MDGEAGSEMISNLLKWVGGWLVEVSDKGLGKAFVLNWFNL